MVSVASFARPTNQATVHVAKPTLLLIGIILEDVGCTVLEDSGKLFLAVVLLGCRILRLLAADIETRGIYL